MTKCIAFLAYQQSSIIKFHVKFKSIQYTHVVLIWKLYSVSETYKTEGNIKMLCLLASTGVVSYIAPCHLLS